jgi:hypothetical protein
MNTNDPSGETIAMTRVRALTGIVVFAIATGGAVISVQATKPVALPAASRTAAPPAHSRHSCIDMNGNTFGWSWSNVPFASQCDARPDAK